MKQTNLPPIQAPRFDIETLGENTISLTEQAEKGPTFIRKSGRVSYVIITEEVFDKLWPDHQRSWSVLEMPARIDRLFEEGLNKALSQSDDAGS